MKTFSLIIALLVTGCAINQSVRPVSVTGGLAEVCIANNPAVLMSEFREELRSQIAARGVKTRLYDGQRPADCRHHVEYSANWAWDMAMYLKYAEINVYDNGLLIGQASYDARQGGANFSKFGRTAEKIRPLIINLFPSRN